MSERELRHLAGGLTITQCCGVAAYRDEIDGGVYCSVCESEVDARTGRVLTEREQERAWLRRQEDEAAIYWPRSTRGRRRD